MQLLTISTAKIAKTRKTGAWEGVLYLSPAKESVPFGGANLCVNAGVCAAVCVGHSSGQMTYSTSKRARVNRTLFYLRERAAFIAQLKLEIGQHVRRCAKNGMRPLVRINGASDLRGLAVTIAKWAEVAHPELRMYDYTKISPLSEPARPNYRLVYSYSERPEADTISQYYLARGGNVAVVFDTKRGRALPETWRGWPVSDGDVSDDRTRDLPGVVIGLRAKGLARKGNNPFVVLA